MEFVVRPVFIIEYTRRSTRMLPALAVLAVFVVLTTTAVHARSSSYCASCARDSHGRIARSPEVREQFMRETGYPHGRPGYVIDHVKPLCHGGADDVANMQWQTKADAAAKDKWECN